MLHHQPPCPVPRTHTTRVRKPPTTGQSAVSLIEPQLEVIRAIMSDDSPCRRRAAQPLAQPHTRADLRARFGPPTVAVYTRRAKMPPLPCVSTASLGEDTAFALGFHRHSQRRNCLCRVFPLFSATETLPPPTNTKPLPCVSAEDQRCACSLQKPRAHSRVRHRPP